MQQRYYDPGIGRFLSVDPVTADSVTGGNFNRYWYANNNPYKFTDPDGRLADTILDVAFIAADVADIASNGFNSTNTTSLVGNVVGALIPGATGLGKLAVAGAAVIKGADKAVAATNRAENVAKGIPASRLGPSGEPKRDIVKTSTLKESKDTARASVGKGGTTVKDQSPAKGGPHHHGVSAQGKKDRVHYEYPKSKK